MTETLTPPTPGAEAASDLMRPGSVLNDAEAAHFPRESVRGEWVDASAAVLRAMGDAEVRQTLMGFAATPVSEKLPQQMLEALPHTPALDEARDRTPLLSEFLALPAVPDERIVPTLQKASPLRIPGGLFGDQGLGTISEAEHNLIDDRYTMAREVKLLALGAELTETGLPQPDETGHVELPSGISIQVDPERADEAVQLLDPTNWESRRKMKDRVHSIRVGGKSYVMKERKTERHTDTVDPARRPSFEPITGSAKEFAVAREFAANPTERDDYLLTWERPLGYVTYPDGFEFVVFDHEEGLQDERTAGLELRRLILDNPTEYQEEYQQIQARSQEFKHYPAVVRAAEHRLPRTLVGALALLAMRGVGLGPKSLDKQRVTFDDFAAAKAAQIVAQGIDVHRAELRSRGYVDPDSDGVLYRVDPATRRLEVIGFDFERYFQPDAELAERFEAHYAKERAGHHRQRLGGYTEVGADYLVYSSMQNAAYLALLDTHDPDFRQVRAQYDQDLATGKEF